MTTQIDSKNMKRKVMVRPTTVPQLKKACREKGMRGVSKLNRHVLRKRLAESMGDIYEFKEHNDILYMILQHLPEEHWCKAAQVSKTYKKVMVEVGFSPWYCMCPRCEAAVLKGDYCVQRDISLCESFDKKEDMVAVLNHNMNRCQDTSEYYWKASICYDLFSLVTKNIWFAKQDPNFCLAFMFKLGDMRRCIDTNNSGKLTRLLGNIFTDSTNGVLWVHEEK